MISCACKPAPLSHPKISKCKSIPAGVMPVSHLIHQLAMSVLTSQNTSIQRASQHVPCSYSKPPPLFTSSPPFHFCSRTLIYSLTTARGDLIKRKTDHVTLLLKPLSLSGFLSQNKIQSLTMVCNSPPVTSLVCLLPLFPLPILFQSHWPPGSCQEQCLLPQDLGTCCPSALSQLSMWHASSLPWPIFKYINYYLNKDNIRTYLLSRAIDDGDSKQRLG